MRSEKPIEVQNTKQKIVSTALDLFANQGYHKTSIQQIAREVNVSKSLIYNYFDSKDHLLAHIIEGFIERGTQLLPSGSIQNLESIDDLIDYLRRLMDDVQSHASYYRLLIMLTLQGTVKQLIMDDVIKKQKELMPQLQAFFHKYHPEHSEAITYLFGAFMDGIVLHFLYMEGQYPLEEVFELFITQLKSFLQT